MPTGGSDGQVLATDCYGTYTWIDQTTSTDSQKLSLSGNTIALVDGGSIDVSTATAVALNTAKTSYPNADASKLAEIEANATADQTPTEIKTV